MRTLLLILSLYTVAACSSNPSPPSPDSGKTGAAAAVNVDNQSSLDMDVYVISRGDPVRLGFAPAKQTTRFALATGLLAGARTIRFEARPTLGGERVESDPYTVHTGDALNWVLPPQ